MYLGHNLRAHPLGRFKFFVDKYTRLPVLICGSLLRFLFAWYDWNTPLLDYCIMCVCEVLQSCSRKLADAWCYRRWFAYLLYHRRHKSAVHFKCAYPVVLLMLALMANSVMSIRMSQSFWSGHSSARNICPIDLFIRSVRPSVCGWKDVDISSLAPSILCSSLHHLEVNFGSLSLTIVLGKPCSLTTSRIYIPDKSLAVIVVCTGIKCTMVVIRQTTTHK